MKRMRISGMATGMDTETMVKDLMKVERARINRFNQNKQVMLWRQEQYNQVNKNFANFVLDIKKELELNTKTFGSMLSKPTAASWVKKAVSSNTGVAEVSGRADAANGNYTVNVQQLAAAWDSASSMNISTGDKTNIATQLGINNGDNIKFTITTNKGSVTIDKTNLEGISLKDIANEINKANIGVTAAYDAAADRFFLQTNDTGSNNTIQITDNSILSDGMSFLTGNNSKLKLQFKDAFDVMQNIVQGATYEGKNALVDIGAAFGIEQQTNQFSVNGVNYNLKSIGSTTVSVSTDVDGIYNKIKVFVDKYNELLDKVNGKISEERYRKFLPLTSDQKEAMKDDEIKQWEEKAQSGLLKNDEAISRALQTMRSGLYEKVVDANGDPIGPYENIFDIGITTGSYRNKGKLEINEDRLKAAIMNDADGVLNLFFQETTITQSESTLTDEQRKQKRAESGLMNRLFDDIVTGMKDVINKSGTGDSADLYRSVKSTILVDFITSMGSISNIDQDINKIGREVDREEYRMGKLEDFYWKKFTAMETAIQKMSAQNGWIMQQMGMGQ